MSVTLRDLALTEIREIIPKRAQAFAPNETVARVLGSLKKFGAYEAAVTSKGVHGIITVRDLLDVDQPNQTKVDSVWRPTGSINPEENVLRLCEYLTKNKVRAIPVVVDALVIGLASQMDVVSAMANVLTISEYPAREFIRSPVWALNTDEKIANARRTMLEKGISHVPIVKNGSIVGVVTAEEIIHTFIGPASKTTTGDRIGRRTSRFPGKVTGIMDANPCTISQDSSLLDVIIALKDHEGNICFMVDSANKIFGVLSPRDIMSPILRLRAPVELPVYIMGIEEEDFFESAVVEEKVRRVVLKSRRFRPDITEVSVRIKRSHFTGERTRYELTGRAHGKDGQINSEAGGWDLLEVFDSLTTRLGEAIRRSKPQHPGRSRRRRSRR